MSVRLFGLVSRIPTRMSAMTSWRDPGRVRVVPVVAAQQSSLPVLGERLTALFSTLMIDERQALVVGLRRRDPELLDRLIEQYQYRLFRYLLYITGDHERAEDFFQETWVRVLERGHQYDGKFKFEAWLFTIARNLVIDWQRQKKMSSLDTLMGQSEGSAPAFEPADEKCESPLGLVLQSEAQEQLQAVLAQLSAMNREVLLLRFQEELQLDEIARIQATPISTVKSRLYRGLEELKRLMAGGGA